MTIDALLFDKDGTLFHFEATWEAWAYAVLMRLSQGDITRARSIGQDVGFDIDQQKFSRDSVVIAGTTLEIVTALQHHVEMPPGDLEDLLNEEAAKTAQCEAVPLIAFLSALKSRGIRIGLATNDAESSARAHLESVGITQFFDFISGYDSGFGAKPDPGPCLAFCTKLGLSPARVAMVGDSLHDMQAGRAAGMKTIAVLTGPARAKDLETFCDVVLHHIGQIPEWLDRTDG